MPPQPHGALVQYSLVSPRVIPLWKGGHPGSGRGAAPRTPACGSPSAQIPASRACLAPAGQSKQPLPAEVSTGHLGHSHLVGLGGRGEGCCSRRSQCLSSLGEKPWPSCPSHPFPPSKVLVLGDLQLQGEVGQRWGEAPSSGAKGTQESAQSPHVLPFPHPACPHPLHGGTTCNHWVSSPEASVRSTTRVNATLKNRLYCPQGPVRGCCTLSPAGEGVCARV